MYAINVDENKSMHWTEVPDLEAGPGEVLIQVKATAINRADLMQRQGMYPPPPGASAVLGLECAGTIVAVGEGVDRWRGGEDVCALLAGGGYAEYAAVPAGSVVSMPDGCSFKEAAALPEVYATAYLNLFMEAELKQGEKVILHAGASGVGTAGIQLCKVFGNPVFITAGNQGKIEQCQALGAQGGFDRHQGSFLEAARVFAGDTGIDVILDPVGGQYLADNLKLLGLNGRLVLIGLMGGAKTEIDLSQLMMKRLRVIGSTLRARPNVEKAAVMSALEQRVWPSLADGTILPVIEAEFPITEVERAYDLVASNETVGKVVLTI